MRDYLLYISIHGISHRATLTFSPDSCVKIRHQDFYLEQYSSENCYPEWTQNVIFDTLEQTQNAILMVPERTNEKNYDLEWTNTQIWDLEWTKNIEERDLERAKSSKNWTLKVPCLSPSQRSAPGLSMLYQTGVLYFDSTRYIAVGHKRFCCI